MTDTITLPRSVVEQALKALNASMPHNNDMDEDWPSHIAARRALRTALEQPNHIAQHLNMVPEGWKPVPVEPTDSQIRAAQDTWWHACNSEMYWDQIYAAMLAAAPQPPVVEQPLKDQLVDWPEVDRLLKTIKYLIGIAERGAGRKMRTDETVDQFVLSYVQALEQQQGEAFCFCDNDISLQSVSGGGAPEGLYGRITLKIGGEFVSYVKEQPQVEQEPMAWMDADTRVLYDHDTSEVDRHHGFKPTVPLYATPPARQPLTEDEIAELMMRVWGCASIAPRHAPAFARAIERAHGIGGEE